VTKEQRLTHWQGLVLVQEQVNRVENRLALAEFVRQSAILLADGGQRVIQTKTDQKCV